MGKFDEIRKIMKEFKGDMDSLASNKINEEQTARARLNPTALEEELTSLAAEYDGHFKSTRNRYKERLNEAIADRRKGNSNKSSFGQSATCIRAYCRFQSKIADSRSRQR